MDEQKIRYGIMVVWVIAFCGMWLFFYKLLPREALLEELESMKLSIQHENWKEAERHMQQYQQILKDKKVVIQSNNATEVYSNFESLIGQLKIAIEIKDHRALEYIEGLKDIGGNLTQAFAGP